MWHSLGVYRSLLINVAFYWYFYFSTDNCRVLSVFITECWHLSLSVGIYHWVLALSLSVGIYHWVLVLITYCGIFHYELAFFTECSASRQRQSKVLTVQERVHTLNNPTVQFEWKQHGRETRDSLNNLSHMAEIDWTICPIWWWQTGQSVPFDSDGLDNLSHLVVTDWTICPIWCWQTGQSVLFGGDRLDNLSHMAVIDWTICPIWQW